MPITIPGRELHRARRAPGGRAAAPGRPHARPLTLGLQRAGLATLAGGSLLLAACGGSSDGEAPIDGGPALTLTQTVRVLDGAIKGARVCLDRNGNGGCDADEVQGTTADDGRVELTVPSAEAGLFPVLALVGTDAVDAEHGPVTTAFTLRAPADKPALVTPLTTLVVAQMDAAGGALGSDAAAQAVADKLGLPAAAVLADYNDAASASTPAAHLARLVVVTMQRQAGMTDGAQDASGAPLAAADVQAAIQRSLITALPGLATAAADPAVAAASSASERQQAIDAAAVRLSTAAGLTAANLGSVVASAKLPAAAEDASAAPTAGALLRWFSFSDAQNYFYREFRASAAQNTVVDGKRRFTEYREQSTGSGGAVTSYRQWGAGLNNLPRNQIVWTGSEWFDCPTDFVHEATPRDAQGRSSSVYCQAYRSTTQRRVRDIAGLKMADVVAEIRAYPMFDNAGSFASWGPDPVVHAAALAGSFPAGAGLAYDTGSDTANPDGYGIASADLVIGYTAAVAGGTAAECAKVGATNAAQFQVAITTLEDMVAAMTGTPCVYTPSAVHEGRNEWWTQSTLSIGDVADRYASATGHYRSGVKNLRVSFAAGNVAKYWLCLRRASDGSARNCDAAGSGTWAIEAQGDGRVLRLAGAPAAAQALSYARNFVQRGESVYYGFRSRLAVTHQIRLNDVAAQALFAALGVPAPRPAPGALTADDLLAVYANAYGNGTMNRASLARMANDPAGVVGAWALGSATEPRAQVIVLFANGEYVMADPVGDAQCGSPGFERGTYAWDKALGRFSAMSNALDSNGCAGLHDTSRPDQPLGSMLLTLAADGRSMLATYDEGGSDTWVRLTQ